MRGLNPRQIEAFRAVVLTGGVGMAAKLINVTQPAVSRMIRDLQQDLGLALFERRGTGLVPTSEALSLYAEVERAFVGLDRIAQMATELRTRRAGFLRIAALPALANGFLPSFAGRFLTERPKLDLVHSTASRFRIDRVFADHGVTRIMRIETPLSEIACSLAGSGAGVTLCDPFTASEYATRGIVVRPFEPRIDFEFAALYATQRTPPPVARRTRSSPARGSDTGSTRTACSAPTTSARCSSTGTPGRR
ncbi:MAG: LysR family transcriptional regulator [Alphaproteobacteria bacterium]|nr:LysR family transcriptional regulator [Alphaproteobacteria bacterium]